MEQYDNTIVEDLNADIAQIQRWWIRRPYLTFLCIGGAVIGIFQMLCYAIKAVGIELATDTRGLWNFGRKFIKNTW